MEKKLRKPSDGVSGTCSSLEFSDSDFLTKFTIKTGDGSKLHSKTQSYQNSCEKVFEEKVMEK
jgi:hypothetical protein